MTVTSGHFNLTPNQRRFKHMLERYPELHPFWDWEKRECDIPALRTYMGVCSTQQRIMAGFFAAVWLRDHTLPFDFLDAAQSLDEEHRVVIVDWFAAPVFP